MKNLFLLSLAALLLCLPESSTQQALGGGHLWKNWRVYLSEFAPQLFNL